MSKLTHETPPDEIIAEAAISEIRKTVEKQEDLVNRVTDAKKALDLACSTFRRDSLDYMAEVDEHLKQFRMSRMALDQEHRNLLQSCADVRKFFLSEEHQEQVKRLNEFAETCKTLKALKDSGFLDAITETILKLA